MAQLLKPGTKIRSPFCAAEFIVVRAPAEPVDLRCGGAPVSDDAIAAGESAVPVAGFDQGSAIGKRYVDEDDTLEVLCTKAGPSSLSKGDELLVLKSAKPLPSSD